MLAVCALPVGVSSLRKPSASSAVSKQVCALNSPPSVTSSSPSSPEQSQCKQFKYSRANPSTRWPHWKPREDEDPSENEIDLFALPLTETHLKRPDAQTPQNANSHSEEKFTPSNLGDTHNMMANTLNIKDDETPQNPQTPPNPQNPQNMVNTNQKMAPTLVTAYNLVTSNSATTHNTMDGETLNKMGNTQCVMAPRFANTHKIMDDESFKTMAKRLSKVALTRATDWKNRVISVSSAICGLNPGELVGDVMEDWIGLLTPTDYCFVVKRVGQTNWQRALEIYEWLNLRIWYSPSAKMVATVLASLGRANQIELAEGIFERAGTEVGNHVQVYNAMMGVYARQGSCEKVQELLNLMRSRGCEPDIVTFNILINARIKARNVGNGDAIEMLREVRRAGLRPDIITYNTLISSCSAIHASDEAEEIFRDMEQCGCKPDLWTYNAMISVYGRSDRDEEAEKLFDSLGAKGLSPDAVTYNALLYAFARNGKAEKVDSVKKQMASAGFRADEITYNTMIHMYGKQGMYDDAFLLYEEMKTSGCRPDAVTFTVLIDSLGKVGLMMKAAKVFSEMSAAQVRPTLCTFSALICGYAKAGMLGEAEESYDCMIRTRIKPDCLAYSVILDVLLKANKFQKAITLCQGMVQEGFKPDPLLYKSMLQVYVKEENQEGVKKLIEVMEASCLHPFTICSLLVKAECDEQAADVLRSAVVQGYPLDHETLLAILRAFCFSSRYDDARSFINFFSDFGTESFTVIHEALIIMLAEATQVEAAREEFEKLNVYCTTICASVYEALIVACERSELFAEASQLYSDFKFYGLTATSDTYKSVVKTYCKMGFPETANYLVGFIPTSDMIEDFSVYISLIEAYGKQKMWQNAESVFREIQLWNLPVDRKVWNAFIYAYAESGRYEQARLAFDQMLKNGLSPTVDTINGLMLALVNGERLEQLQVLIEELQQIGFKISKSSIFLMFHAFAKVGNIHEVKRIYDDMKVADYSPNMQIYRTFIHLLCKKGQVRDVELVLKDMEAAGFRPDISICNSLLSLYMSTGNSKKVIEVYQCMQAAGVSHNSSTYSIIISMYSRTLRIGEAFAILKEMKASGHEATLNSYKELLSACARLQQWEDTEELFCEMQSCCKLDRSAYHIMMKAYRSAGEYEKAEKLLDEMRTSGIEPNFTTMHMLMDSYGKGGDPERAENVFKDLEDAGLNLGTAQYNSVMNAYLKAGDHAMAIEKLMKMRADGLKPDCRTWTCIVGTASMCKCMSEALNLLGALGSVGFTLPIRLLTESSANLVSEFDILLEEIELEEEGVGFGFVNVIEDLLWAFERRATAAWIFQMAVKKKIYPEDVVRVEDKDWRADFRRLSAGAALTGLTLWMDHMQDASLQGVPEASKSVVLVTGSSIYRNAVSVHKTLRSFLMQMGSPFYPSKTHTGILVAKGHALRMWLKDSPFCMDLELKDSQSLPDYSSMDIYEGSFMRAEMISVSRQIQEQLGKVSPKKFSRFSIMTEEKREKAISAELKSRQQMLENRKGTIKLKRQRKFKRHFM